VTGDRSIYLPLPVDGYELCHPTSQRDFELINTEVSGLRQGPRWRPIRMRLIRQDGGRSLLESDSPWLGTHALIFRRQAVEVLEPLLSQCGELLPLESGAADMLMYNPMLLANALDEGASTVGRFGTGRIMDVKTYVFNPEVVRNVEAFKVSALRVSPTYVGDAFVQRWKAAHLSGLEFKRLWSERPISLARQH
jgi:hypothetical protein